jgi:hypothetical protein
VTAPGKVVVDSDGVVYFTSGQPEAVYECAAAGCNGQPTVALSGQGAIGDIQVDAKRLYAVVGAQSNQPSGNGSAPHAPMGAAILWIAK